MNISETLEYIHSVKWVGSKPGLSRTQTLLAALGNPEKSLKFIHIAGTNGKGSTAAMISNVLTCSGYRTGLYTSPYITRFNERMQIDGVYISDDELCALTEIIRPHADAMEDSPTEFELITALGMLYFKRHNCDIVVLEVGMGGELDSTNVIDTPLLAVITAMGMDHVKELGGTFESICEAKAGIIKPGGDAVVYGAETEAVQVFKKRCDEVGASFTRVDFTKLNVKSVTPDGCVCDFGTYKDLEIPLAGTYQPNNMALAVTALDALREKGWGITEESLRRGLKTVRWPGRFEVLRRNPLVILDGAHNDHGAAAAADSFEKMFPGKKIVFLSGVMADKDVEHMFARLAPLALCFVCVTPHNPRAMQGHDLAALISEKFGVTACCAPSIADGAAIALKIAGADGIVAALGSLYFSADVTKQITTNR